MNNVKIDVEYCGSCGHKKQFQQLSEIIKKVVPDAGISGLNGRQASFEIKVNGELIYSKLQSRAFPEFSEVAEVVKEVSDGQTPRIINKQQINHCEIM